MDYRNLDITTLNKAELSDLHKEVTRRLNNAISIESQEKAAKLFAGARVSFRGKRNELLLGTVNKVNSRTCSVKADNGQNWRVDAGLLDII